MVVSIYRKHKGKGMRFSFQQPFVGGALRDATKNGCVGDCILSRSTPENSVNIGVPKKASCCQSDCLEMKTIFNRSLRAARGGLATQRIGREYL